MAERIKPVIIAGAGPVGLTAARLLQEQGIPFLVLEADTRLADDLRASTFHPPSLDMLDRLGAAQPLIAQGLITPTWQIRSEEHTSELQSLMRISYAVFCLKKQNN